MGLASLCVTFQYTTGKDKLGISNLTHDFRVVSDPLVES